MPLHTTPSTLENTGIFFMIFILSTRPTLHTHQPDQPPNLLVLLLHCATTCLPTLPAYCTIWVTNYFRFHLTRPIALLVLPSFTNESSTPSRGKTHPPTPPTSSLMVVRVPCFPLRWYVDSSVIRPYLPHVDFMKRSDSLLPICQTGLLARYRYP